MARFTVLVTQEIEVELDEAQFTEEFMEEFRASFFGYSTIEEHAEHIAQLQARGIIDLEGRATEFVEGYGPSEEMGINTRILDFTTEVLQ